MTLPRPWALCSRRARRPSTSTSRCRTTATWPHDKLLHDGEVVGVSTFSGYSYNKRSMLSLGYVDVDVPVGAELVMVWGEDGGGSTKPVVERHRQAEIRVVVSPCPYSDLVRTSYHGGVAHEGRRGLRLQRSRKTPGVSEDRRSRSAPMYRSVAPRGEAASRCRSSLCESRERAGSGMRRDAPC